MPGPDAGPQGPQDETDLKAERWELLDHVTALTDKLMIALAFVWLGLLILDFTQGLGPALQAVSTAIWALFGLDFVVKFAIAPQKAAYLRRNWLTAVSLLLPAFRALRAFRAFRLLRAARAVRSVGLLRLVTSLNRGMRALGHAVGRRG
ncbi:MAG: ion transporter, partial [Singulisphaera sp.]